MVARRTWGNRKERTQLEFDVVLTIARRLLVDKAEVRDVAKELNLPTRKVADIRAAKSHKELWVDAIAYLAREGLLNG